MAECTLKFFQHLRKERFWHWKPRPGIGMSDKEIMEDAVRRPMIMLANGLGANVMAYYTVFHMRSDNRTPLATTLRACMMVNPHVYLDKTLTKNIKHLIRLCSRAVHGR